MKYSGQAYEFRVYKTIGQFITRQPRLIIKYKKTFSEREYEKLFEKENTQIET